ncbi:hypothetical protein V8E55_008956 [Tylopilus felleus]
MSQTVVEAGPSSATRPRVRLTKKGALFLQNYVRTVNAYPQRAEKETILAGLRAIPGNDTFSMQKLNSWLTRHRNPSGQSHVDPPPTHLTMFVGDSHTVTLDEEVIRKSVHADVIPLTKTPLLTVFPKLAPYQLSQLRLLYKKRTDPKEGIITFWAQRLGVESSEVVAWIQYQQEKAKENEARATPESPEIPLQQLAGDSPSVSPTVSDFPRPHLPTPAKSPSISPHTRMPSLPPIAVKVEDLRQCLSPVSSLNTSSPLFNSRPASGIQPSESRFVLEGLPPLSRVQQAKTSPVSPTIPTSPKSTITLAASIRESLGPAPVSSEPPPRTADEFAGRFEKVENMIQAFMNKYKSGRLAPLGWDSSASLLSRWGDAHCGG